MTLRLFLLIGALLAVESCATPSVGATAPGAIVKSTDVSGWFRPAPFQRIIDLQQATFFYPDLIGFCLQIDPVWFIGLEGCLGGLFLVTTAHLDLRMPVFHYLQLSDDLLLDGSSRIHGWEVGIGPMTGVRDVIFVALFSPSTSFTGIDAGLSAEAVYWFTKRIGLKMQLDVGATIGVAGNGAPRIPFVESRIGVAF